MNKIGSKSLALLVMASVLGVALAGLALPVASATSYSNVQVFVQTKSSDLDSFTISAYNSTGGLVTYSQSIYPAFSMELPNGQYLFTVSATKQPAYYYPYASPLAAAASSAPAAKASLIMPCCYRPPPMEYGYLLQQVSGSTTLSISTQNVSALPTTTLTISVHFANNTAAKGASVSAYVVGGSYWWYYNSKVSMWNTTNANGIATLTVPSVPVIASAWTWVPVNLPKNETTVQTIVGGQKVNVTVYWQPTYVGLAGSALIIPPQTQASITLKVQQPNYWVMPYGVSNVAASRGGATMASAQGGVPSGIYQMYNGAPQLQGFPTTANPPTVTPTQLPVSLPSSSTGTTSQQPDSVLLLSIVAVAALGVAAASLFVAAKARKK